MSNPKSVINCTVDELVSAIVAALLPPPKLAFNQELIANGTVIVTHRAVGGDTFTDLQGKSVADPDAPGPMPPVASPPLQYPARLPNGLYVSMSASTLVNVIATWDERRLYTDMTPAELDAFYRGPFAFAYFSAAAGYLFKANLKAAGFLS